MAMAAFTPIWFRSLELVGLSGWLESWMVNWMKK